MSRNGNRRPAPPAPRSIGAVGNAGRFFVAAALPAGEIAVHVAGPGVLAIPIATRTQGGAGAAAGVGGIVAGAVVVAVGAVRVAGGVRAVAALLTGGHSGQARAGAHAQAVVALARIAGRFAVPYTGRIVRARAAGEAGGDLLFTTGQRGGVLCRAGALTIVVGGIHHSVCGRVPGARASVEAGRS